MQVTYALHSLLFLMHVSYTLCYSCGLMSDSLIFGCQPYWVLLRSRLVWCNTASQLHMRSSLILCMSAFTLCPLMYFTCRFTLHSSLVWCKTCCRLCFSLVWSVNNLHTPLLFDLMKTFHLFGLVQVNYLFLWEGERTITIHSITKSVIGI
jgi:hypothetical protein